MTVIPPPAPFSPPFTVANDFSPLRAVVYGWNKFTQNRWTWVLAILVAALLMFTVVGILVVGPFLTRGALLEIDGRKPRLADFFRGIDWGPAIVVQALVLAVVLSPVVMAFGLTWGTLSIAENTFTGVLSVFFFGLAALVVIALTFLTYYAAFFVIDGKAGPVGSLKASVSVIRKNLGPLLLLAILNEVIVSAGATALYVGLLVAYPVYLIASAYSYRFVTGGLVSADQPLPPLPPNPEPPLDPVYVPEPTKVLRIFPPMPPPAA